MSHLIVYGILLAVGFAIGRIKNSSKLSAVSAEVAKVEAGVSTDLKAVAAKIKSIL